MCVGEREEQRNRVPGASNFGGGKSTRGCGESGESPRGKQTKNEHGGADDAGQFSPCIHCNHLPSWVFVCGGNRNVWQKKSGKGKPSGRASAGRGKAKTEPRKRPTESQRKKSIIHSSYHLRLIKEMPKAAGSVARIRLQC